MCGLLFAAHYGSLESDVCFFSWSGVVRDGKGGPVGLQRGAAVLQPGGVPVLPQEQGHRQSGVLCRRRVKARARGSPSATSCAPLACRNAIAAVDPLFLFSVVVVLLIELCCVPLVVFALAPDQSSDLISCCGPTPASVRRGAVKTSARFFAGLPSFLPPGVLIS